MLSSERCSSSQCSARLHAEKNRTLMDELSVLARAELFQRSSSPFRDLIALNLHSHLLAVFKRCREDVKDGAAPGKFKYAA